MAQEENQQELVFKLSMFEQQIQQLQQQLQAVEQGIIDIKKLSMDLDEISGSKDKEMFAPIGRGIFIKSKVVSEDLTVDIGGRNFVSKSVPETKKIIESQIDKLEDVKRELSSNIEAVSGEMGKMIQEVQGK